MKLMCIDYGFYPGLLTEGKFYECSHSFSFKGDMYYCIIDDKGGSFGYNAKHFKTIDEVRDNTIDKILK